MSIWEQFNWTEVFPPGDRIRLPPRDVFGPLRLEGRPGMGKDSFDLAKWMKEHFVLSEEVGKVQAEAAIYQYTKADAHLSQRMMRGILDQETAEAHDEMHVDY